MRTLQQVLSLSEYLFRFLIYDACRSFFKLSICKPHIYLKVFYDMSNLYLCTRRYASADSASLEFISFRLFSS